MYLGKRSIIVNSDLKAVFEAAETYPSFVRFFLDGSKVLSQDEKRLLVEVHTRIFGLHTSWEGEGLKGRYRFIRFRQTRGLFKGLIARWSFLPVPEGTKVRILTRFRKPWFTPLGEFWLGRVLVERVTKKILHELKINAEAAGDVSLAVKKPGTYAVL